MSEPSSPEEEANAEPKPGPPNPSAGGLDRQAPPGGPQRQDAVETTEVPDGREAEESESTSSTGSSTIPLEEEQPHPERDYHSDDLQEENAGTSLDEPSEDLR